MKWLQFRKNEEKKVDEHEEPTEPLPELVYPPVPGGEVIPGGETIPAPQPPVQPFPHLYTDEAGRVNTAPLPPFPAPVLSEKDRLRLSPQRDSASELRRPVPLGRRVTPLLVGSCFVLGQFLLLARFVLKLVQAPASGWIDILYAISSVLVFPLRLLLPYTFTPLHLNVEVYTLLAIFIYGLCSRLIVHILKMVLS